MAYARKTVYRRRRPTFKRRYTKKRAYASKKRTYRRKALPVRRILNVSSQKKRDTMIHDNTTASPLDAAVWFPTQTNVTPFIPTARDLDETGDKDYSRKSQTVYMRGFRDAFTIATNDATPWEIRYVAFRYKGPFILESNAPGTFFYKTNPIGGYNRAAGVYQPSQVPALLIEMFKGSNGIDWTDAQTAALDRNRVSVVMDLKFNVRSGNESGTFMRKKVWVPYNANLVYGGDERGDRQDSFSLSTNGNRGNGDLYVIIFANAQGDPLASSRASVLFESTVYWHER